MNNERTPYVSGYYAAQSLKQLMGLHRTAGREEYVVDIMKEFVRNTRGFLGQNEQSAAWQQGFFYGLWEMERQPEEG